MSNSFNDGFDTDQTSGTWNPPSSRQFASPGAPGTISASTLNITLGIVGSVDPSLAYIFNSTEDLSNIGSFTFQNVTVGSLTVTVFNNLGQANTSSNGNFVVFVSPPSLLYPTALFVFLGRRICE